MFHRALCKKGSDLTQIYAKNHYNHWKTQKATWRHKNAIINVYYTTIAKRLRRVTWSDDNHWTGVVKPIDGIQNLPTHLNCWVIKNTNMYLLFHWKLNTKYNVKYVLSGITALHKNINIDFYLDVYTIFNRKKPHCIINRKREWCLIQIFWNIECLITQQFNQNVNKQHPFNWCC